MLRASSAARGEDLAPGRVSCSLRFGFRHFRKAVWVLAPLVSALGCSASPSAAPSNNDGGKTGAGAGGQQATGAGGGRSGTGGALSGAGGEAGLSEAELEPFDTSVIQIDGDGVDSYCRLSDDRRSLIVKLRNAGEKTAPELTVELATRDTPHRLRRTTDSLAPGANSELVFERGPVAGFPEEWDFEIAVDPDGVRGPAPAKQVGHCSGLRERTALAMKVLNSWYDEATGLWNKNAWWTGANMLEVSIDYARQTSDATYLKLIDTSFVKNADGAKHPDGWDLSKGNFLNEYYDDEGWWALAWIKAYDLTGEQKYLAMAKTIFSAMLEGWDDKCGGGVYWRTPHVAKNAIPNELFLTIAARLYTRTEEQSYLDWAKREWTWFKQTGMIKENGQIVDGLNAECVPGGPAYTYNQGVILGGLVELYRATSDASLLDQAEKIANAALEHMTSADGVFIESICDEGNTCDANDDDDSDGCRCGGGDGIQFKGVFARNLAVLYEERPRPEYQKFLIRQSEAIWARARSKDDKLGKNWQGVYDEQGDASRQSSAMDALIGAVRVSSLNLAVGRKASGSAACSANEGLRNAVDGNGASKWCSGGLSGQNLAVDLGSAQEVVGFRVRHAGSGGEKAGWNTRDFAIEVSDDQTNWSEVVKVVGNTENITTHHIPQVSARYVRLLVEKSQTAEDFPAARIYELEVYGSRRVHPEFASDP